MKRILSFETPERPALYLVATPIGNLSEISERTREILEGVDLIACEDTRVSAKLLHHLGISKPLLSYHEHNQKSAAPKILEALRQGKSVALVSDAGYPLISDPGDLLVDEVLALDFPVVPISGPNAAINALVASGLPANHYLYYGFLPAKSSQRIRELKMLAGFPWTMIFYEAPHRIEDCLKDLLEVFGDRKICLARELTKRYEEFLHGSVKEILEVCGSLKGEMVLVVSGYEKPSDFEGALQAAGQLVKEGLKLKEACKRAAAEFGVSKNELYQALLEKKEQEN